MRGARCRCGRLDGGGTLVNALFPKEEPEPVAEPVVVLDDVSDEAAPPNVQVKGEADGILPEEAAVDQGDLSSFAVDPTDYSMIPSEVGPFGFVLGDAQGPAPWLSADCLIDITSALSPYLATGAPVGFMLVDLESGRGIGYNIDAEIYGASSFKGPYCAYVCEEYIEAGDCSITDSIPSIGETSSGGYVSNGSATVRDLVFSTVVYSSNGTFGALREYFDDGHLRGWLEELDADASIAEGTEWFPRYTVRDAARFWTEMNSYLNSGTPTADWLAGLLSETNVSFLRDALADVEGATVMNKAGWCADVTSATDYDSVCDNGIVTIDGRSYLMCVMTGAPYTNANVECIQGVAAAVFSARDCLA